MEDPVYQDVCYVATSGEVPQPFDRETMNKLHIEAMRAEDSSRQKFEEQKRARKTQEKLMHETHICRIKKDAKTKITKQEEHPLSKSFSGSIEAAQMHINNKVTSANGSSHINTASALDGEQQQQQSSAHHMAKALRDDQVEFSAKDTKHSGAQRLEDSMESVRTAISAGDEELARQQAEWNMMEAELFGTQDYEQVLSHKSNHCEPQVTGTREGTEEILKEAKDSLERPSQSISKELEEVDEASKTRQRELDHSFRALLNDHEY